MLTRYLKLCYILQIFCSTCYFCFEVPMKTLSNFAVNPLIFRPQLLPTNTNYSHKKNIISISNMYMNKCRRYFYFLLCKLLDWKFDLHNYKGTGNLKSTSVIIFYFALWKPWHCNSIFYLPLHNIASYFSPLGRLLLGYINCLTLSKCHFTANHSSY